MGKLYTYIVICQATGSQVEARRSLVGRALIRYEKGVLSGSDPLLEKEAEAFTVYVRGVAD